MEPRPQHLAALIDQSCLVHGDLPALGTRTPAGWKWWTYRELSAQIARCRAGLSAVGVKPGDTVAIISNNRAEWAVACYAAVGIGAAVVSMYESQRATDWELILEDSEATIAFVSTAARAAVLHAKPRLPRLSHVIGFDLAPEEDDAFAALIAKGENSPVSIQPADPESTAALIYTSGTTGKPKGVMLSHRNILSQLAAIGETFPLDTSDRSLSFLPWAHVFGQVCELHYALTRGASLALNDDVSRLIDNLAEVRPTVLVAVPRIFNHLYEGVYRQLSEKPAVLRRLFEGGVRSATKRLHGQKLGLKEALELAFDDKVVFRKIRMRFGGNLRFVVSGGAALSPEVEDLIEALGIPLFQGYGLSETSPVVSLNTPSCHKRGSVGRPLPGVRVVIDTSRGITGKDGEIVVYGPNVMRGYLHRPVETAATLTNDGGLRTGDIGYVDDDGYLFVTGRIKDQYKLENGKYVMPTIVEEQMELSPFIANAMIYGHNRPYNVAVIVPEKAAIEHWATERGVGAVDPTSDPDIRELLMAEVRRQLATLPAYVVPEAILITLEPFTVENGLLTPTLKLKRAAAEARFGSMLEDLYAATNESRGSRDALGKSDPANKTGARPRPRQRPRPAT